MVNDSARVRGSQYRLPIESGDPRRSPAQEACGCQSHNNIKIKDRTNVGLRYVPFLDQGGAEAAVKEDPDNGDENGQHPDETELLGKEEPRQNDPDDELHAPLCYGLDKAPG